MCSHMALSVKTAPAALSCIVKRNVQTQRNTKNRGNAKVLEMLRLRKGAQGQNNKDSQRETEKVQMWKDRECDAGL